MDENRIWGRNRGNLHFASWIAPQEINHNEFTIISHLYTHICNASCIKFSSENHTSILCRKTEHSLRDLQCNNFPHTTNLSLPLPESISRFPILLWDKTCTSRVFKFGDVFPEQVSQLRQKKCHTCVIMQHGNQYGLLRVEHSEAHAQRGC